MKTKWLVVGAGITGSVFAERIASQLGEQVVLIDRRDHVAGNTYDCLDDSGVLVHKYGPHIFHTNDQVVWEYLSQFTEWRPYEHLVLGLVHGKYIPLPFNFNSLEMLFPGGVVEELKNVLIATFGENNNVPILQMLTNADVKVRELSTFIFKSVFENYTLKQWGVKPETLGPSVTGRVPVRMGRDNRYFQDRYQAMPTEGFTALFQRILAHPNIRVELGTSFESVKGSIPYDRLLFTGPIDEYFNYAHGPLPYRSLEFEREHIACDRLQEVATINFPNDYAHTRTTEFKHLTGQNVAGTSIMREYPCDYVRGKNEAHYPVPLPASAEIYSLYAEAAKRLDGKVLFAGRLGGYKYLNMDQAVRSALSLFQEVAGISQADEKTTLR